VTPELIFWWAAGLILYVYPGYPLLLWGLQHFFSRPVRKRPIQPTVSLLVAACNEAGVIEEKIRNSLALDYPPDRLEIIIASDGSTDGTVALAERISREAGAGGRVRVFADPRHRGKLATLNGAVSQLRSEIIVFSDASSILTPHAIRSLAANFADPEVGAVSGLYRLRKKGDAALGHQEDLYWKYETFLKRQEAALGSVLGAHGALYAVRRKLYPFPPPATINDDYVIPVRILQQGYRVAYEPDAVAYEEARDMEGFSRRVRLMTGNFQQLRELQGLCRPLQPLPLFFFLSHKAGRLAVPLAMLALAFSNALLLSAPFYWWTWHGQALFYGLVALGAVWRIRPRFLRLPYYFCMINAAAFLGIYHALIKRRVAWKQGS